MATTLYNTKISLSVTSEEVVQASNNDVSCRGINSDLDKVVSCSFSTGDLSDKFPDGSTDGFAYKSGTLTTTEIFLYNFFNLNHTTLSGKYLLVIIKDASTSNTLTIKNYTYSMTELSNVGEFALIKIPNIASNIRLDVSVGTIEVECYLFNGE